MNNWNVLTLEELVNVSEETGIRFVIEDGQITGKE